MGIVSTLLTEAESLLGVSQPYYAASRFRLNSTTGYNIPKPKSMFWVNFVATNLTQQTLTQTSFFVKRTDRLQVSYDVQEMNQYNKKRLVQTKLSYQPINMTFHDTISGDAVKFIQAYNQNYYGDFFMKNDSSWVYDIVGSTFEPVGPWGLFAGASPNIQNFLQRIEVYEFYNQNYSQVDFINPKITNFDMQPMSTDDVTGAEITMQFRYEGAVFTAVAAPITQQIATLVGLPYSNNFLTGLIGGLNIPGYDIGSGFGLPGQSLLSTAAVGLQNSGVLALSAPVFNGVNSLLNGNTPAAATQNQTFNTSNGIFQGLGIGGSTPPTTFNPSSVTGSVVPSVGNQINSGIPATQTSTGISNLFSTPISF